MSRLSGPEREPLRFQVTEVENGFLVVFPGVTMMNPQTREQVQSLGKQHFCKDYDEFVAYMKEVWPSDLTLYHT